MKLVLPIALLLAAPAAAEPSQLASLAFDRGSAQLPVHVAHDKTLGKVTAWALANPDGILVIDGHADRGGSSSVNVRLSLARAQNVRELLEDCGVNPDQIVIAAYGERRGQRRVVIWGTRADEAVPSVAIAVRERIRRRTP